MAITAFSIALALAMCLHVGIVLYVQYSCENDIKNSFSLILLPGFILLLSFLLEINSVTIEEAVISRKLLHTGFPFTVTALFIFACNYCYVRIPKLVYFYLVLAALFIAVTAWTNDIHNLFYNNMELNIDAFLPYLMRDIRPLGVFSRIHTLALMAIAIFISFYRFFTTNNKSRKRLSLIIVAMVVSLIFMAAYLVKPFGLEINYGVFATITFVVLASISITSHNALDVIIMKDNSTGISGFSKLLLDASPLMLEIWDDKMNIVGCNQKLLDTFGVASKEEYFTRYYEFSPEFQQNGEPSKEISETFIEDVFKNGKNQMEWEHILPTGEILPVHSFAKLITHNGKTLVIEYMQDLREIKETKALEQEAEEANKAKSNFLAKMSHEIRTPIAAILGIAEIQLKKTILSRDTEAAISQIHSSGTMLLNLINDILDISKIEMNKMDLVIDEYEVASLISDTSNICRAYIVEKDIKFNLIIDENLPAYLIGDYHRVEQIIFNLLSNAFKYTEHGEVELKMYKKENNRKGFITLAIFVQDTGLGMTKEQVSTIFEEYVRFHEKQTTVAGTGLGMPIVHKLLELMNAKIDIKSEPNVGTKVTVSIPQQISRAELLGKETASRLQMFDMSAIRPTKWYEVEPESMPYGKVLVVDDVDANLYVAEGLLNFYDLEIETCQSGIDAIEKIKSGKVYDIIFMDQMMPKMDGTTAMKKIRSEGYTNPIIVLTANALIGQEEIYIKDGFDGYISKPMKTKILDNILHKFVKERQLSDVIKNTSVKPQAKNINEYQTDTELIKKLKVNFLRSYENKINELRNLINKNDLKNAEIFAHSLKGQAGLIFESRLFTIAEDTEFLINKGGVPNDEELDILEQELINVIERVDVNSNEIKKSNVNKDEALELLEKIKPMLESRKTAARNSLGVLKDLPEAAILIKQIEKYDFATALKSLDSLILILKD